jgi:polyisoprenoid-binding protein YceI
MTTTTIQQIPSGTYVVDPVHSTFGFTVKHNGISTFRGQFEKVDAKLADGVLVGIAQVESIKTAIPDLKAHLLSPDFFNAAETPTVEFRSAQIRIADDGAAEVDGDLTVRGVTKPVTAKGTLASGSNLMGADVVGLDLEATIDRREFGLNWQAELPRGGEVLAWDVTLAVQLELIKG